MLRLSWLPFLFAVQAQGTRLPAFRVGFLPQLTNQDIPHRHAQRLPSQVIPDSVKLTVSTGQHAGLDHHSTCAGWPCVIQFLVADIQG